MGHDEKISRGRCKKMAVIRVICHCFRRQYGVSNSIFSRKKEWMELLHRKLQGKSDITAETGVSVQRKEDFLLEPS